MLPSTTESGRDTLDDGALGLRLSRSIGRIDLSALAYSGSDHEPLGRVIQNDAEVFVEQFYKRRSLFGASAETSLGSIALRAEAAYQPSRTFNTRGDDGLQTAEADQFSAGIAADINGPMGIFVNLQLLWDEINNAPSTLVRPDRDRVGTVFLRRSFAYDTVKAEARWYHSFDDNDDLYKLTLDYQLEDNTAIFISGDWFTGTSSGLFGQFAKRDRVVLGIRHTF
jgi:predicted porin